MKRDELDSQVMLEIFRNEIRWYHFVTPEARNIVTDRVRTDVVKRLAAAGKVDIGTAESGCYSVPSLINNAGAGSTSPEPGPATLAAGPISELATEVHGLLGDVARRVRERESGPDGEVA